MDRLDALKCPGWLKPGKCIPCRDKSEMLEKTVELGKAGIQTEFVYKMYGKEGLWLRIEEIEDVG